MFEIAGGIFVFVLAWLALQAAIAVISLIFHALNDWAYSVRRHSRLLAKRESALSEPPPARW